MRAPGRIRFFTVEEANRTLPLVRRIVDDILGEHSRLQTLLGRFEGARAGGAPEVPELRDEIGRASAALEAYLAELHSIGCLFKGAPEGLVDFYSLRDGRPVFLCWKLGEEEIQYWHQLETGFRGREPLVSGALPAGGHEYGPEG
ncbi:MAG: DUF2203 domain-containing protein [Gemmatimonadota bacterium]